eukprot:6567290-Alexandrium_andersonii.AAC.1
MSASLVGSEMCIRDRFTAARVLGLRQGAADQVAIRAPPTDRLRASRNSCLLYTSDAADDM